jgi:putative transposase
MDAGDMPIDIYLNIFTVLYMNPPSDKLRDWPHAPLHRLGEPGAYIITAGTYQKQRFFNSPEKLTFLTNTVLDLAERCDYALQAWSVFSNHYHLIIETIEPASLKRFTRQMHTATARDINASDQSPDRKVWFQYWETHLTFPKSYLARLSYVHSNAVRHRLVRKPENYPWCSAGWFARRADKSFYRTVMTFPCDQVQVPDEFDCGAANPPILAS